MKLTQKLLINQIKDASKNNKKYTITKFLRSTEELLKFLTENRVIEGYKKKHDLMIIFLKYTEIKNPIIKEISVVPNNRKVIKTLNENFVIN